MKATRLFGLEPITHMDALVFAGRELELQVGGQVERFGSDWYQTNPFLDRK